MSHGKDSLKTEAGTIIGICAGMAVGLFLDMLIGAHWAPIGLMLAGLALGRALGVCLDRHYDRFTSYGQTRPAISAAEPARSGSQPVWHEQETHP